jgi:lysophospholipase L1-like esterase
MRLGLMQTVVPSLLALLLIAAGACGQETVARTNAEFQWLAFPDSARFKVLGIHWFDENNPKLWRMPTREMDSLPNGVQNRSKFPSGGRIVTRCTTTRLAMRATSVSGSGLKAFDVYVNGQPCKSKVSDKNGAESEMVLFEGADDREKEIVIYLPHLQEVVVQAIGVDRETRFTAPEHRYARPLPVVFYGSSVCQGSGAVHPGQTYESILCRELNLDFVNLGFGGAGKAEANVVALVNAIPACCYVFDLGKSYGAQDATAFKAMLQTIRRSHPDTPLIAMTPITSIKEIKEASYSERSIHTRAVMREPVNELIQAGDKRILLVEGEDLLGFKEHDALSKDGVHPSEQGYRIIAAKLAPVLKKALGL